jgi:hypothetical protein
MQKPILHNRLVRLWGNPSRQKFRAFYRSTHGLFDDHDDAQNLVKYGAHLIVKGNEKVLDIQPYDPSKGLENWIKTIEGDILFHVGIEYFIKGIYLHLGYSINKARDPKKLAAP